MSPPPMHGHAARLPSAPREPDRSPPSPARYLLPAPPPPPPCPPPRHVARARTSQKGGFLRPYPPASRSCAHNCLSPSLGPSLPPALPPGPPLPLLLPGSRHPDRREQRRVLPRPTPAHIGSSALGGALALAVAVAVADQTELEARPAPPRETSAPLPPRARGHASRPCAHPLRHGLDLPPPPLLPFLASPLSHSQTSAHLPSSSRLRRARQKWVRTLLLAAACEKEVWPPPSRPL